MPNFTARLGLRKPLSTEFYDVNAEFNANMQNIDDNAVLMDIPNVITANIGADAMLKCQIGAPGTVTNSRWLDLKGVGNSDSSYIVDFDGGMQWGPGNAFPDVNLKRTAVDTLYTDDGLRCNHASMQTVMAGDNTTATVSSTSFTTTPLSGTALSVGYTAPPSGKIKVTVTAQLYMSTGGTGSFAQMSASGSGSAGTWSATDERSLMNPNLAPFRASTCFLISGLTALATGTASTSYRRSAASGGNGTFLFRSIMVEPCLN